MKHKRGQNLPAQWRDRVHSTGGIARRALTFNATPPAVSPITFSEIASGDGELAIVAMRKVSAHRQLLLDLSEGTLPPSGIAGSAAHERAGDRQESLVNRSEVTPPRRAVDSPETVRLPPMPSVHDATCDSITPLDSSAPVAESVASLCRRIVERLSKSRGSTNGDGKPLEELGRRLRGLAIPFSFSEDSLVTGARWPVNRLSDDDMRRLRVLSNLTGKPVNGLLHFAVQTLFDQTKWLVSQLVALHERSGTPLLELLGQALPQPPDQSVNALEATGRRMDQGDDAAPTRVDLLNTRAADDSSMPNGRRAEASCAAECSRE